MMRENLMAAALGTVLLLGCERGDGYEPRKSRLTVLSAEALDWARYQVGNGPWLPLDNAFGVNHFETPTRFTLAYVCREARMGEIIQADTWEMDMIRIPCGKPLAFYSRGDARHAWRGALRGAPAGSKLMVAFGSYSVSLPATVTGSEYAIDLPAVGYDVMAVALTPDGGGRLVIKRLAVTADGPGTLDIDFGEGAVTLEERPLQLPAPDAGESLQAAVTITSAGRGASIRIESSRPGQVTMAPAAQLGPGDMQQLSVNGVGATRQQLRGFVRTIEDDQLPPVDLPPTFATPAASLAATAPVARPSVTFQRQPAALFYQLVASSPAGGFTWVVNASARSLGDASLVLPDLSAVPGFDPAWGPLPGIPLLLEVTAVTSSRRLDDLIDGISQPPPDESTTFAKKVLFL
jgi:hypothetical protein